MESLLQDLRYGVRMLLKQPAFTLIAVVTLALAIGANSAIFSVVNAVVLRSLPYPQSERLMMVWLFNPRQGIDKDITSFPNFEDWRKQSRLFDSLAGYYGINYNLTNAGDPEQLRGAIVTADFFHTLGIEPEEGRTFAADENSPGREKVVVLSRGLWQRRFGADPLLVGKAVTLNGSGYTVVGIMPRGFQYPAETELWTPMAPEGPLQQLMALRGSLWMSVIGRLKPGVPLLQAQAEMDTIAKRLEQQFPANAGMGIKLEPLRDQIVGDVRWALLIMLGAIGFVLLIACANIANLLLARAAARQKEIAIRAAVGADRGRLIRQLLTESILLSLVGGALGLLLAVWGVDLLMSISPPKLPRLGEIRIDGTVLAVTMLLSILTGLFFGLAPAVQASKTGLSEILKEGGRSAEGGPGRSRLRSALVIVEVALAVVLLIGAGLMIRSFLRLLDTKPGFDPEHVLTMRIALPRLKYREPDQVRSFYQQLLQKLESLPGVQSVGASTSIMLGRLPASSNLSVEGRPVPSSASRVDIPVTYDSVTPKFFPTMGISLVRGRLFSDHDDARSPRVAIINEALVRRFFPTEDPLRKRITFDDPQRTDSTWFSIVGVVGDVRRSGLDAEPRAELYIPHNQSPDRSLTIVLRTTSDPAALARVARSELWMIDKDQPVSSVKTMDQIMNESLSQRRFNVLLLGLFAAVAIILASVGIYGVMAYSVTQRTHEIGIRMALGAKQGDVLRLVVRQGMILAAAGLLLGLALAWSLTRVMRGIVYGVSTTDPVTFVMISLLFGGVALAASYLPARRASKVDPMVALRSE